LLFELCTFFLNIFFCSINGIPACANSKLLTTILRDEWNFTGYVVSDMGAIENMITQHHYYTDLLETVAGCVNAGCNLELSANQKLPIYLFMCKYSHNVCTNVVSLNPVQVRCTRYNIM
jgi:beta-glucosidase